MTESGAPAEVGSGRCIQCGGTDEQRVVHELWSTEPRELFSIVECGSCHTLRTVPVPDDLDPYYRTRPGRWMRAPASPLFSFLRRALLWREARRVASLAVGCAFLEVGPGSGSFALALRRQGHRVFTADAGEETPAETAARGDIPHLRFDFTRCEVDGLPEGSYAVVLRHVLEHVKEPRTLLTRLQSQGAEAFYLVVPNVACVERRLFGKSWFLWDPPRHLWHFDSRSLAHLCRTAGLEIVRGGHDTIGNVAPSVYRALELRGWSRLARPFAPKSTLNALTAPLNLALPGNVVWVLARRSAV